MTCSLFSTETPRPEESSGTPAQAPRLAVQMRQPTRVGRHAPRPRAMPMPAEIMPGAKRRGNTDFPISLIK
jgi:hypothetical protein